MHNISDLRPSEEILPLLDFTMNDDARSELRRLLAKPLDSVRAIEERQAILKGFIANIEVVRNYSYSRIDFHEMQLFLEDKGLQKVQKGLRWKLFFSKRERHLLRSKALQLLILLYRLHQRYIQPLELIHFPVDYKPELQLINNFLLGFKLDHYNHLLQEDSFGNAHLAELIELIAEKQSTEEVAAFFKTLFHFEAYVSIACGIDRHKFCFPTFDSAIMAFTQAYHPLLMQPVRNDIDCNSNIVLLTGPNMSGKSTFLKSLGLCVYLAHLGLAVPAAQATMPFFDTIVVSINHNDDLLSGYSHFMSEIMRLKDVLLECEKGHRCFAVFDELFKGTNIDDAVQISTTTINGLTKFMGSYFLLSTHLHQIKSIDAVRSGAVDTYYVDCKLLEEQPVFTYRICKGWSEVKVGQLLFKKEGLDELLKV